MYIKSFSVVQTPFRSYLSLSWRGLRMYHLTHFVWYVVVRSGTSRFRINGPEPLDPVSSEHLVRALDTGVRRAVLRQ